MTYPISDVTRRVVYSGSLGTGPYPFTFEILTTGDIGVYKNTTLLTLSADYTVTINADGTGSVTLTSAATSTDTISIFGNKGIQRQTDFTTGGDLFANSLNDELDAQTIFAQQNSEAILRSIRAPVTDPTTIDMVLPSKADRADTVLTFDTDGNPSATSSSAFVAGLSGSILGANYVTNNATGDGSTTAFTVSVAPGSKTNIQIYIDGVYQNKASFSLSGTTVTFTQAPPLNSSIEFMIGYALQSLTGAASIDFTQAGTGAVTRTVESKLQDVVSVKDFGATGDGVTDDASSIQNALSSGATAVYFPSGTYAIGSVLTFPAVIQKLYGHNDAIIKAKTAGTIPFTIDSVSKLEITGLEFQTATGAAEGTANRVIEISNSNDITIKNCLFTECVNRALEALTSTNIKVINNTFTDCSNGIYFVSCSDSIISGNIIDGSQQSLSTFKIGIALHTDTTGAGGDLPTNISVVNNIVQNLGNAQGIMCHGGRNITITGNAIFECAQGINCNPYSGAPNDQDHFNITINGNTLTGPDSAGSYTTTSNLGITVTGLGTAGNYGNYSVCGNTIDRFNLLDEKSAGGGIYINGIQKSVISGNKIKNCGRAGIYIGQVNEKILISSNVVSDITRSGTPATGYGIELSSGAANSTGIMVDNIFEDVERSYRFDGDCPEMYVESSEDPNFTSGSAGVTRVVFNGHLNHTTQDDPEVYPRVKSIYLTAAAYNLTDLTGGYTGQMISLYANNAVVVKDVSTTGNFQLSGGSDFTFGSNDMLLLTYNGTNWLEVSRSVN